MKENDDWGILSRHDVQPVLWLDAGDTAKDKRVVSGAPLAHPSGVVDLLRVERRAADAGVLWQWVALDARWSADFDHLMHRSPFRSSTDAAPPSHEVDSSLNVSTPFKAEEDGGVDGERQRMELQRARIYDWLLENPTGPALLAFSPQGDLIAEGNSLKEVRAAAWARGASTQGALLCGRAQVESFAP
jgi:hypothetical protein